MCGPLVSAVLAFVSRRSATTATVLEELAVADNASADRQCGLAGVMRRQWRHVSYAFPVLMIGVNFVRARDAYHGRDV